MDLTLHKERTMFNPNPFRVMIYLYTPYPDVRMAMGLGTAIERVNPRQYTAHTLAQAGQTQVSAEHAGMHGPHKHKTRARMHGVSSKINRLANAQTRARCAQTGVKHAHTSRTCSASTRAGHLIFRCRCWHNWPPKKCDPREWWKMALTSAVL